MTPSYTISSDEKAITCRRCGMTSHNPGDVAELYCGHCHAFHGETMRPCRAKGCPMIVVLVLGQMLPGYCSKHDD